MDIAFNVSHISPERRHRIYDGEILVLTASSSSLALVQHARQFVDEAFSHRDPRHAHEQLEVKAAVEILSQLKPRFIHDPQTKTLLQQLLLDCGCDARDIYQDVPRLRVAYPANYLTTGIAYAHHAHRDTWYSAPPSQINWWMPLYDFEATQGMAFHPRYWARAVSNSSRSFNYYRWNADGRKNAAQHLGTDTRQQPRAQETLELEPAVRLVVPAGSIIVFSADQLHSTVRNETASARWSIDFRTVSLDDLTDRRGAPMPDSACLGTSLRDFRRVLDFDRIPGPIVKMYDSGADDESVLEFAPNLMGASAQKLQTPIGPTGSSEHLQTPSKNETSPFG